MQVKLTPAEYTPPRALTCTQALDVRRPSAQHLHPALAPFLQPLSRRTCTYPAPPRRALERPLGPTPTGHWRAGLCLITLPSRRYVLHVLHELIISEEHYMIDSQLQNSCGPTQSERRAAMTFSSSQGQSCFRVRGCRHRIIRRPPLTSSTQSRFI